MDDFSFVEGVGYGYEDGYANGSAETNNANNGMVEDYDGADDDEIEDLCSMMDDENCGSLQNNNLKVKLPYFESFVDEYIKCVNEEFVATDEMFFEDQGI